jgi:putative DNA primase/helicase
MFAVVALAGEIAARAGIVPWTAATADDYSDSDSVNAAVSLFNRWKENRSVTPTSCSNEHSSILVAVSDFIERHSESRFSDVNATPHVTKMGHSIEPPIVRDRAGYWDDSSGSRIYLFTNSGLREATKAYDFRRVIKALDDAKAFTKKGTDKTSVLTRIPNGGIMRLYYIDPAQLQTL